MRINLERIDSGSRPLPLAPAARRRLMLDPDPWGPWAGGALVLAIVVGALVALALAGCRRAELRAGATCSSSASCPAWQRCMKGRCVSRPAPTRPTTCATPGGPLWAAVQR